jgi:hypothetical protein
MIALTFVPSSSVTSIGTPTSGTSLFACSLARLRFGWSRRLSMITHVVKGGIVRALQLPDRPRGASLGPQYQCRIARRMCFIAALFRSHLDELADGPSFQAELAFPYDSFVQLA